MQRWRSTQSHFHEIKGCFLLRSLRPLLSIWRLENRLGCGKGEQQIPRKTCVIHVPPILSFFVDPGYCIFAIHSSDHTTRPGTRSQDCGAGNPGTSARKGQPCRRATRKKPLGVSKNRGGPLKWMVYNGKPYCLMDDLGVPLFLETSI